VKRLGNGVSSDTLNATGVDMLNARRIDELTSG